MPSYAYRLVNVFAESLLAGNPLCVFEDGRGLDDATMQALALQFNLSETTFVLPSTTSRRRDVRIFTPSFEMPFAGHPTLGTAHVVRSLAATADSVTLEMRAGVIPVSAKGDRWTLAANAPKHRAPTASRAELAATLGLAEADVAPDAARPPLWVDTGSEQLVIPLASPDAVRRAAPRPDLMQIHGSNGTRAMAYVFAPEPAEAGDSDDLQRAVARFFFPKHGAIVEDPGTGSACANLGGWLHRHGRAVAAADCDRARRPGGTALPHASRSRRRRTHLGDRARDRARARERHAVG